MKLSKEKAAFLKVFSSLAKGADILKTSVVINVKENKVTFTQYGTEYFAVFTEIDIDNSKNENFRVVWNTNKVFSLLEALNYDAEITETGISTTTGHYTLENFKLKEPDGVEDFFKNPDTIIPVNNFANLFLAKDFVGEDQWSYIVIDKNKMIATNKTVGFTDELNIAPELANKINKLLFIHKDIAKVFNSKDFISQTYEIGLYDSMNFWSIKNISMNIKVFLNFMAYGVINFEAPDFKKRYEHSDFIVLSKKEFYKKLKIMMVFANSNPNRRLFFKFSGGKLFIENRNITPVSSDSVDCKYPQSFEDRYIVVDGGYILMFENLLSDVFKIKISFEEAPIKFENYIENGQDPRLMIYSRLRED